MQDKISFKIADAVYKYYEAYEGNKRKAFGLINNLELKMTNRYAFVGQAVELKLDGIENYDNYLYKLEVKKDNKTVYSTEYVNEFKNNYSVNEDGIYDVTYYIKQKDSENEYDDKISGNFIAFKLPEIKNLTIDTQKVYVDKPIIIKADKENGSYELMDYTFEIYSEQNLIASVSNNEGVLQYTPKSEGEYRVICYIKDKLSDSQFDDKKK
ncbi:hypothetical protein PL321_18080 [Caloramator sp. mosi_1]|uniref:hypothetical protein n=1 Tax=Caloramator sp. mosi_1 TaxID=3023090 RepID=UPI002362ECCD|nr:hypothetical protein [Caloramator sp. mosi_1]WDC84144.1 hypothetical protein PL321_18080 [Caloramator sp. mosi_1]